MDVKIKEAFEIEKSGNFQSALEHYMEVSRENLTCADKVFLDRSIGACLFYLKKYEEAEKKFNEIIKNYELEIDRKKEIQNCINLCYLYGGKPETAKEKFLEILKFSECSEEEKCWNYWYLGQCCFYMIDYIKMEEFYEKCVTLASQLNYFNFSFFIAHLMVSEILNKKYIEFQKNMKLMEGEEDKSFGLLKIVESIYMRNTGKTDWKRLYDQGIKEAEESKYIENIELGHFLLTGNINR